MRDDYKKRACKYDEQCISAARVIVMTCGIFLEPET